MSGKKKNPDVLDLKKDQVMTAVVMADSFDKKFRPISEDVARCLLPLGHRPLLGYTLDFLKNSGIQECIVFCSSHHNQIKQYLQSASWTRENNSSMNVIVTTNEECRSFGDAMRDLDGQGLLRGDFFLVSGDTISNVDLRPILEAHKTRAKEDKNASMTLVYRKASPGYHCRTTQDEVIAATDRNTQRLLHYQRLADQKRIAFPVEIFQENSNVELCHDLLDPCIAICSQSIPPLFADNFDFQTLDSFIQGILTDDLVDNTLYVSVLNEGYAARVSNIRNYLSISTDVLRRWLYPIVPEVDAEDRDYRCKLHRRNVYKCPDVQLFQGSQLERDVLLDTGCSVGEYSTLSASLVGKSCNVGNSVSIKNSIIMDKVKIGRDCKIEGAVIGSNAVLGEGVVIQPRSVVGFGVHIPPNTVVPSETRLVRQPKDDGFSDDEDESGNREGEFGPSAHRYVNSDEESEDEEEDGAEKAGGQDGHKFAAVWGLTLEESRRRVVGKDQVENDSSSSDESDEFEGMDEVGGDLLDDDVAKNTVFHNEVLDSLQRGVSQNLSPENLIVEINSSRHAYNESWSSVVHSVTKSLLHIGCDTEEDLKGSKLLKAVKNVVEKFKTMLRSYCKSEATELDCLHALEDFAFENSDFAAIAKNSIHLLYDLEIVSEDAIFLWYAQKGSRGEISEEEKVEFAGKIRQGVKPLIDWLQEDEESEDDSD